MNIIHVEATGRGAGPCRKGIAVWSNLRTVSSMRTYFDNMNTYHISYAAYEQQDAETSGEYVRARRYVPDARNGLNGTALQPNYPGAGFFGAGIPHRITIIKKAGDLFMHIRAGGKEQLCHWKTDSLPPIVEGRIGLRHMGTLGARYRDFRVFFLKGVSPVSGTGKR